MGSKKYVVDEGTGVGRQGVRRRVRKVWGLLDSVAEAVEGGGVREFDSRHGRVLQGS